MIDKLQERIDLRKAERDELGEAYNILQQQTRDVQVRLADAIAGVNELEALKAELVKDDAETEDDDN